MASEVIHFRAKRYFAKFKGQVVGMLAFKEKTGALYVRSLAVNPGHRRLGIGTYLLNYVDKLAKRMKKRWLELSVLKADTPAQRLYKKFGFIKKEERK